MRGRRIGFLLIGALDIWALLYTGKDVFLFVLLFLLAIPLLGLILLLLTALSFRFRLTVSPPFVSKGAEAGFEIHTVARFFPAAHVGIRVRIPEIDENHNANEIYVASPGIARPDVITIPIASRYAGKFTLTVTKVSFIDIFGLFQISVPAKRLCRGTPAALIVLPEEKFGNEIRNVSSELLAPIHRTRERAEPIGVREYRRGDDTRTIHWKHSARIGKLLVKEYERGSQEAHHVYIDLTDTVLSGSDKWAARDLLLCGAAGICRFFLRRQIRIEVHAYGAAGDSVFSGSADRDWPSFRYYLSDCDFVPRVPENYCDFVASVMLQEQNTVTVISMAEDIRPLAFLISGRNDLSILTIFLLSSGTGRDKQKELARYLVDRGIRTYVLHDPSAMPEGGVDSGT